MAGCQCDIILYRTDSRYLGNLISNLIIFNRFWLNSTQRAPPPLQAWQRGNGGGTGADKVKLWQFDLKSQWSGHPLRHRDELLGQARALKHRNAEIEDIWDQICGLLHKTSKEPPWSSDLVNTWGARERERENGSWHLSPLSLSLLSWLLPSSPWRPSRARYVIFFAQLKISPFYVWTGYISPN